MLNLKALDLDFLNPAVNKKRNHVKISLSLDFVYYFLYQYSIALKNAIENS